MTAQQQKAAILVTGARGKTGREVVELLRQRPDVAVRAGTSRPAAPGVPAATGVTPTTFDWADPASWPAATRGVDRVYVMRPDVPDAPDLVAGLVDMVPGAHVVLLSEQGAGDLPDDHWARLVESAVTERAASWTLLRPSWFHQVFTDPRFYRDDVRDGRLSLPFGGGRIAWVDARDIAAVAVEALLHPDAHTGRAHTITGPEALTAAEVAGSLSAGLGRPVRVVEPPAAEAIGDADPWTAGILTDLYDRVRRGGFAPVTSTVPAVAGRPARTLDGFVQEHLDAWRAADARHRAS